jgi:hypothetical protein
MDQRSARDKIAALAGNGIGMTAPFIMVARELANLMPV